MSLRRGTLFLLLTVLAVAVMGTDVLAYYTDVYDTTHACEEDLHAGLPTHPEWWNHGGSQHGCGDLLDRLYGAGNYERIEDSFDQIWYDMDGSIEVQAKYAADYHWLGYSLNETTGSPIVWLDDGCGGYLDDVGETAVFDVVPNSDVFVWVLGNCETYYSVDAMNNDSGDHMVTFKITNLQDTYVIAWDNGGGDEDFQDFVFELSNVAPVPEPATILLLGLGGIMLRRKKGRA